MNFIDQELMTHHSYQSSIILYIFRIKFSYMVLLFDNLACALRVNINFSRKKQQKVTIINIPKTLSYAHQKWDSGQFGHGNKRCEEVIKLGTASHIAVRNEIFISLDQKYKITRNNINTLSSYKNVVFRGIKYIMNRSTLLVRTADYLPLFACIKYIVVINDKTIFFCVNEFETLGYDDDCCAYYIKESNKHTPHQLYSYDIILEHHTMTTVPHGDGHMHVVLDYQYNSIDFVINGIKNI